MEEASPTKHEYVAGQIYALAGASDRHNRIAMNIAGHLWQAARGGPCHVYGSDMRLRVANTAVYYPDVQVVCDPSDTEEIYKTRPCVIVEVISPSTESVDLREKLVAYQSLESLEAYIVVWRDHMRALEHYRAEERRWFAALHGRDDAIQFPCPKTALTLAEIYEGVELPGR